MSLPQLHELLLKLGNGFPFGMLLQLQMASYCARAQTHHLNPLVHSCGTSSLKHVEVKGGLMEFVPLLLSWEAEVPKRKGRGIYKEVVEEVGRVRKD